MAAIKSGNTRPEMVVRSAAHALGYRFRLRRRDLPGKPDLVFPGRRKIVFVHGCFWHQHSSPACRDGRAPKSRLEYWGPKLKRNAERDLASIATLEADGWRVLVVWECETKDRERLKRKLARFLGSKA